jgi:hypothetical protein
MRGGSATLIALGMVQPPVTETTLFFFFFFSPCWVGQITSMVLRVTTHKGQTLNLCFFYFWPCEPGQTTPMDHRSDSTTSIFFLGVVKRPQALGGGPN